MANVVFYGGATASEARRTAQRDGAVDWANSAGHVIVAELFEGRGAIRGPVEKRARLHLALFLLRAGLADILYVPELASLGSDDDHRLIEACVRSAHGVLLVRGTQTAVESGTEQACIQLLERAHPRQRVTDVRMGIDAAMGEYDSRFESGRLAHKLRHDAELTYKQIAFILNMNDYCPPGAGPWTESQVGTLLAEHHHAERLHAHRREARVPSALTAPMMVVAGATAKALLPRASAYNAALSRPFPHVVPLPTGAETDEGGDCIEAQAAFIAPLVSGASSALVGAYYVDDVRSLGASPISRAVLYASCARLGVSIVVNGTPLGLAERMDPEAEAIRMTAMAAVRLHAALRDHDVYSVHDGEIGLEAAAEVAQRLRANGRTLQQIANHLNEEGFRTRKRIGRWYAAAVSELLRHGTDAP